MNEKFKIDSTLDNLVEEIRKLPNLTISSIENCLSSYTHKISQIASLAEFSLEYPYGRKIVANTDTFEVLLTGWEQNSECLPHDHGGSDGLILICGGTAENQSYSLQGYKLNITRRESVQAGNFFSVAKGEIHATAHKGNQRMIGLHVYWPPVYSMQVYEPETNRIFTVTGDSGAWIPENPNNIIKSLMVCEPLRQYELKGNQKNTELIQTAIQYIEEHPLFRHPFFELFAKGKLSDDQIKIWAIQRHFSSSNFPRFLGQFIAHITDETVRTAYIKQAWEEHGKLDPEKIHAKQLRQLIYALGVSQEELQTAKMLQGTEKFVNSYWDITRSGDLYRTMGAFALGTEPVVPLEMKLCLRGLKTVKGVNDGDKIYFRDHAYHDYRHTKELVDVMLPTLKNFQHYEKALQGMMEIINARKGLYDSIAKECGIRLN